MFRRNRNIVTWATVEAIVIELLLPRTDAGVLAQAFLAAAALGAALVLTWRTPEWRLFVIGLGMLAVGFFGFRALH